MFETIVEEVNTSINIIGFEMPHEIQSTFHSAPHTYHILVIEKPDAPEQQA